MFKAIFLEIASKKKKNIKILLINLDSYKKKNI